MGKKEENIEEIDVQKIEEEIESQTKLSKEALSKVYMKMFWYAIFAISVMAYLYVSNLISFKCDNGIFQMIMKCSAMILLVFSIVLFEISYKKDKFVFAKRGIEILLIAIFSIVLIYLIVLQANIYFYIIALISFSYGIYYLTNAVVVFLIERKKYLKSMNDISSIIK